MPLWILADGAQSELLANFAAGYLPSSAPLLRLRGTRHIWIDALDMTTLGHDRRFRDLCGMSACAPGVAE